MNRERTAFRSRNQKTKSTIATTVIIVVINTVTVTATMTKRITVSAPYVLTAASATIIRSYFVIPAMWECTGFVMALSAFPMRLKHGDVMDVNGH